MRDVTTGLAFVAILAAPLHAGLASGPADAPPPPGESAPASGEPGDDLTPEERAKQLGWEEEESSQEEVVEEQAVEGDSSEDEDEEEDEPDDDDGIDEDDIIDADPELRERYRKAKGLTIGGGVSLGVGAVLAITGGTILGLESTLSAASGGFLASPRAVVTGAVLVSIGAAGFIAGAVLLPIGLVKRKHVTDEAEDRLRAQKRQAMVVPWFDRRSAGLSVAGRF